MRIFEHGLRVYYEDTDLGEVVYYANYLKFIERGRTEALREIGYEQGDLKADGNLLFVVRNVQADYLMPARFDDWLIVRSWVSRIGGASLTFDQEVWRDDQKLFSAKVGIVGVDRNIRPMRIPAELRKGFEVE